MGDNVPVGDGTQTPGADDTPDPATESLLSAGEQGICDVNPDDNGLAGGIWDTQFDVQVAGRPTTAADEYVGLITVTVTAI